MSLLRLLHNLFKQDHVCVGGYENTSKLRIIKGWTRSRFRKNTKKFTNLLLSLFPLAQCKIMPSSAKMRGNVFGFSAVKRLPFFLVNLDFVTNREL